MEYWIEGTEEKYIYYYYDESGISGISYCGTEFYFHKNIFGDVVAIYDKNKDLQATYDYDAWGNHTVTNATDDNIGDVNPIRYRGYYYDVETQLFYCNSRYYSPELCRWISPDSIEYLDQSSINGLNLYCYCINDPVNLYNLSGHSAILFIVGFISSAVIGGLVSGRIAAGTAAISGGDIGAAFCGGMWFAAGFGGNVLTQSIS